MNRKKIDVLEVIGLFSTRIFVLRTIQFSNHTCKAVGICLFIQTLCKQNNLMNVFLLQTEFFICCVS